jgi:6-phosphogluconate dehydrogenase
MVPAGSPTRQTIERLAGILEVGDVVVDGGNSRYTDSLDGAEIFASRGIGSCDVGVSGGRWGLEEGYCLMVGAEEGMFARLEPIFAAMAPDSGYARVGDVGSGHFTKMVHEDGS